LVTQNASGTAGLGHKQGKIRTKSAPAVTPAAPVCHNKDKLTSSATKAATSATIIKNRFCILIVGPNLRQKSQRMVRHVGSGSEA
jgi:hypothetical protein